MFRFVHQFYFEREQARSCLFRLAYISRSCSKNFREVMFKAIKNVLFEAAGMVALIFAIYLLVLFSI